MSHQLLGRGLPKVPNESRISKWRLETAPWSVILAAAATPTRPLKSDLYHAGAGGLTALGTSGSTLPWVSA